MNLNWIGTLSFLKICTLFLYFWSQIGVGILVTPKEEVVRKNECFCGVKFFCSNFKEKTVFEQKFAFLLVVCSHAAILFDFYCFFDFSEWINGFPNPFIVYSRPSFSVWPKFLFLASGFLFTCGILTLIFCFLKNFDLIFGFPNSLIVRSRSSLFLFSHKNFFELYVRICPAMIYTCCSGVQNLMQIRLRFYFLDLHKIGPFQRFSCCCKR